jgi:hypothetical protein
MIIFSISASVWALRAFAEVSFCMAGPFIVDLFESGLQKRGNPEHLNAYTSRMTQAMDTRMRMITNNGLLDIIVDRLHSILLLGIGQKDEILKLPVLSTRVVCFGKRGIFGLFSRFACLNPCLHGMLILPHAD